MTVIGSGSGAPLPVVGIASQDLHGAKVRLMQQRAPAFVIPGTLTGPTSQRPLAMVATSGCHDHNDTAEIRSEKLLMERDAIVLHLQTDGTEVLIRKQNRSLPPAWSPVIVTLPLSFGLWPGCPIVATWNWA